MTGKLRFNITILFLAVYLAETLVVSVTHRHWCALSPLAVSSLDGVSEQDACAGDHEHLCSASTEDAESKPAQDSQPLRVPCHDEDNCPICRHLALRPLCGETVCEPLSGELVELVQPVQPAHFVATFRLAHRSRGPPA